MLPWTMPRLGQDGHGVVHVMAYDGVLFCMQHVGFIRSHGVSAPVTCLSCMRGWQGNPLREG